jgi:hypothetical protein
MFVIFHVHCNYLIIVDGSMNVSNSVVSVFLVLAFKSMILESYLNQLRIKNIKR